MTDLYYRPHLRETPGPLPFSAMTVNDEPPQARSDLANHPESVVECGFVLAPPRPDDTDTQTVEWDHDAEDWIMVDRPPAPPAPEPEPISMTVGEFVNRFRIPDEVDAFDQLEDAMALESRLVRRQWANDATVMTEGDGLWTIIAGHLDSIVTAERKAELLGAAFADQAMAA